MFHSSRRLLALDVTSRGLAFAVFEGRRSLIDWGLIQLRSRGTRSYLSRVEALLNRFQPSILVLEAAGRGFRRGSRVRDLLLALEAEGEAQHRSVIRISRSRVKEVFAETGSTKQAIAQAIAAKFPELEKRLPRPRKPWMSEDERMNLFDAASFALAAYADS